MAARSQTLPAVAPSDAGSTAPANGSGGFLKNELAPYPGRAWVVGRITIAATIVMLLVMTFRIPMRISGRYLHALSQPGKSYRQRCVPALGDGGLRCIATVYTVIGIMTAGRRSAHSLSVDRRFRCSSPSILIRIIPDYVTAVGFGFTLAGAIPLWDETFLTVEDQRTENTLWLAFSVVVGLGGDHCR